MSDQDLLFITFVVILVIFTLTAVVSLLSIIGFGASQKHLITLEPKNRTALFTVLLLEVVGVVIAAGTLFLDKLSETEQLLRSTIEVRQPSTLHDYVLLQRDATRVRILGINGLGVLHKYRKNLVGVLRREDALVEVLLLDPDSDAFLDRRNLEEASPTQSTPESQFVSGRLHAEWKASRAVLRDIVNQLVNEHSIDITKLSARLKIRKHQYKPEFSFLFVDTNDDEHFLIYNEYTEKRPEPGTSGTSTLVYPGDNRYVRAEERFGFLWDDNDTSEISLEKFASELARPTLQSLDSLPPLARSFMAHRRMDLQRFRIGRSIPLQTMVYHPQGIEKVNEHFFVSAVEVIESPQRSTSPVTARELDRAQGKGRGHLFKFDESGKLIDQIILGEGPIYHPGGLGYDGKDLWVPVAEYRPDSHTIVYRVDPVDLGAREAFRVDDHIGALVFNRTEQLVHGASWASRQFYTWTPSGDLVEHSVNGNGYVDYQDCQFVRPKHMLCSGMAMYSPPGHAQFALGGIDLIRITDYLPIHQTPVTIYPEDNAEVVMARNAMYAELNLGVLTFYFLPEGSQTPPTRSDEAGFEADTDAEKQALSRIYVVEAITR